MANNLCSEVHLESIVSELPNSAHSIPPGVYSHVDSQENTGLRIIDSERHQSFDVIRCSNLLSSSNPTLASYLYGRRALCLIDPQVEKIYGSQIRSYFGMTDIEYVEYCLPPRATPEENKSFHMFGRVTEWILDQDIDDDDVILVFGGGVLMDLGGSVADFTRRGSLSYLSVPTTLIGMVDAAVSPKTAVNVGSHKNGGGGRYAAEAVLIDAEFLLTLDRAALMDGLSEILKVAIVGDAALFDVVERDGEELVRCCFQSQTGAEVLQRSIERFLQMKAESGKPSIRAFGHKFSRQLERRSDYRLSHGEAVAIEQRIASFLSADEGILGQQDLSRIQACFDRLGLPQFADVCDVDYIWKRVFEKPFQKRYPFHFPIPGPEIGQGSFLGRFSRTQLACAASQARKMAGDRILRVTGLRQDDTRS